MLLIVLCTLAQGCCFLALTVVSFSSSILSLDPSTVNDLTLSKNFL